LPSTSRAAFSDVDRAFVRLSARKKSGKLIHMKTKTDPLARQRAHLAAAENALLASRETMRVQAKTLGIPHASLFGESPFVLRGSAERWVKEAHSEGWDDARAVDKENTRALERIAKDAADDRAAGRPSAFAHLAGCGEAIQKALKNAAQYKIDPAGCDADWLEQHRFIETAMALSKLCKSSGVDFETAFPPGSLATPAKLAMAQRIVEGANRRDAVVDLAERRGSKK
jgi:hypothetical protein